MVVVEATPQYVVCFDVFVYLEILARVIPVGRCGFVPSLAPGRNNLISNADAEICWRATILLRTTHMCKYILQPSLL